MSKTDIIVRMHRDGTFHRVMPDGTEIPVSDPGPLAPRTEEEISEAARRDPYAQSITDEEFRRARKVPRIKTLRRALALTQKSLPPATISRSEPCATGSKAVRSPTNPHVPISLPSHATRRVCAAPSKPSRAAELVRNPEDCDARQRPRGTVERSSARGPPAASPQVPT